MFFSSSDARVGMIVVYIELVSSVFLNGISLYILLRKPKRTVGDLLLTHLSCTEVALAALRLVFGSIYIYFDSNTESEIHLIVESILLTCIYQSMISITLDRAFAVKLTYRYKIIVTKKKTFIALVIVHLISLMVGFLKWQMCDSVHHQIVAMVNSLVWDCLILIITVVGYTYIILTILIARKILNKSSSSIPTLKIKYTIPLCITGTFVCFCVVPDLICVINRNLYSVWLVVIWNLNLISDPLIYVLISKCKIKRRAPPVKIEKSKLYELPAILVPRSNEV